MMRRILSRFRTVAPPAWTVAFVMIVFGVFIIPRVVFGLQPAQPPDSPPRRFLIFCSVLLGVYRVIAFHPYFRQNYLRWLKSTPWNVRKPLPLGPVELVPEDALGIGLIILLGATLPAPRSIEFVNVFLFSHLLTLVVTFWRTGVAGVGYIALMLLGFVPLLWWRPWLNLLVLVGIYLLVHEGLWRALKRFPWETEGILIDLKLVQKTEVSSECGWFFDRFHRDINTANGISRIDALLGCMLGSWWLFVLAWLSPNPAQRFGFLIFATTAFTMVSSLIRFAIYIQGCRPPISFWGRLGTFRWIIPGFDQIYVAPIGSLLVSPAALLLFRNSQIPAEICLSIAAGLTVLIALICPPRLRRWRLTGRQRLVPTLTESQAASAHKMGQP
jgi:hypothetical protein